MKLVALEEHASADESADVNALKAKVAAKEVRVFYDVADEAVEVLAIVARSEAAACLEQHGEPEQDIAEGQGEPKS